MIKKLRFRFILVSLLSVLFVLSSTIGAMNIYNYTNVESDANTTLVRIIDNGFREDIMPKAQNQNEGQPPEGDPGRNILNEMYFIVAFNSDGSISKYDYQHIFSIGDSECEQLATSVYNGKASKGKNGNLRFKKEVRSDATYVAFVDIKQKLDDVGVFLRISIVVSLISYIVLAGLIVFASFLVFKPTEESYKKQKRFITNASHELKTPLTIISTDLEIVELDHGKSEWTESSRDQINRLTQMTNQLVTLSKIDEEDMKNYPFEDFSISELINHCVETFLPSFEKQGLSLSHDVSDGINYHGNKYLIDELFYILFDNALKYTKENGKVAIFLKNTDKNRINFVISNDIDADSQIDVEQLFDRFYRSPDNKKTGSGIGLSIAQEIVRLHKGEIKAKIENNQIVFSISL